MRGRAGSAGRAGSRRYGLGVLRRGLRWRAESSLVLLLVALAATLAAAAGPTYLESAGISTLRRTIGVLPAWETGMQVSPPSGVAVPPARIEAAAAQAPRGAGGQALFGAPVLTETVGVELGRYSADVLSRTDLCAHVTFAAGSCPSAAGDVALSTRTAAVLGARLGGTVTIQVTRIGGYVASARLRVAGVYDVPDTSASYWWGNDYFQFGEGFATGGASVLVDDLIVAPATFASEQALVDPYVTADLPMNLDAVETTGIPATDAAIAGYQNLLRTPRFALVATTELTGSLGSVGNEQHLMTTVVVVVDLELVLLALCVLYSVVSRTAEERELETRLARLRGFPLRSVLSVAAVEPSVVVLLALPIGILLGWGVVAAAGSALFAPGTPVGVGGFTVLAAAAACAGGVVAIALSSLQLARRSPIAGDVPARARGGWRRDALDWTACLLAVAALVELATTGVLQGSRPNPVAAAAPALVTLGLAVLGLRLVPLACSVLARATRGSERLVRYLAIRGIARRPPLLRQVVLLSVAFGLLAFACSGWYVARQNRALYASFSVGAARVVTVSFPPGADFVGDVRRADPSGHEAMAVAIYHGAAGALLAVDSSRLASVASWSTGLSRESLAAIARQLHPPAPAAVTLTGTQLRVTVGLATPVRPAITLVATLFDDTYQATTSVTLGTLRPGTHSYTASIAGACGTRCRLVSLSPQWQPAPAGPGAGGSGSGSGGSGGGDPPASPATAVRLRLDSLADLNSGRWQVLDAYLGDASDWHAIPEDTGAPLPSLGLTSAGTSLLLRIPPADYASATDDVEPAIGLDDVPQPIPVVMTSTLAALERGPVQAAETIEDLDGSTISVRDRVDVALLPAVGSQASMIDLTFALDALTTQTIDASYQVWLAPGASPAILERLMADGFKVTGTTSAASLTASLDRGGMALAYDLFLFAGLAAVVLAVGSTLFSIRVAARRTAAELAALEVVGAPRRTLLGAVLAENAVIAFVGVAFGVVGGVLAVSLALPSLPELATTTGVPPLDYGLPTPILALVLGLGAVVVGLTVIAATVLTMAGVRPELLRQEAG